MENRVYYGEYSLKHWLELILKGNIMLPEYQRLFVWNETKVKTLIDALKGKQFVPPVTIGAFKDNGNTQNIILDGQQRLTSILLAYLGLFPDKDIYKNTLVERNADENDSVEDEDEPLDDILDWRFDKLTEKGKNKEDILDRIIPGNYKHFNLGVNDDFLKNTFLGFSYLVPQVTDLQKQQKYYSTVFRSINYQGEKLSVQESRKSLYFLDDTLAQYFDPDFCREIKIKNSTIASKIDFVRYLSLISQYKKNDGASRVARGYKPYMEKFYEEYIHSITGNNTSQMFDDFSANFPNKNYHLRFIALEKAIDDLSIPNLFVSIIDSDMYMFGLIYMIVFVGKEIDTDKKNELQDAIKDKIIEYKDDPSHARSPSALKYLRSRISNSIEIYGRYEK